MTALERQESPVADTGRQQRDFSDTGSPDTSIFDGQRERAAAIVARYPHPRSALLPLLHLVQHVEGHVGRAGVAFCAEVLDITAAEVSAVATFYTMYKREPVGEHLVSVCTNTLCAALGGDDIYAAIRERLGGIGHQETSGTAGEPGSLTIEHAECLAACDLAPVLTVDYEFFDRQTVDSALEIVDALQRGEKPHPTRGAPLTDFRRVELLLAGFFDEPELGGAAANAGPSADEATLAGARLAEERSWTAPPMPDRGPDRTTEASELPGGPS
jgi:NADH-quinone oxidoreductase subunit E